MSVGILVVDDESDVTELFRQHLRHEARQGTYVLHFAYSGEEALDKLRAGIEPAADRDPVGHKHAGHGRTGAASRDQDATARAAGDDGDRLRRRSTATP